jgi:hypothetical protein
VPGETTSLEPEATTGLGFDTEFGLWFCNSRGSIASTCKKNKDQLFEKGR